MHMPLFSLALFGCSEQILRTSSHGTSVAMQEGQKQLQAAHAEKGFIHLVGRSGASARTALEWQQLF